MSELTNFSNQLADAVQAAGAWTVRVQARRGPPASGIALAADLVLTADHVVDPSREDNIRIGLPDGSEVQATVVGRDPATDVAILRIAGGTLTAAKSATSEPRTGALALVVGRPGAQPNASLGLITGSGGPTRTRRGGMLERFIMVDAVMYPGFSGGPLVDADGAVLGMITSGLGFGGPAVALPWSLVSQIAETIKTHGRVARGYLGIGSQPITLSAQAKELAGGQERGLLVIQVADGGPAAAAGVLQGDILVRLDGNGIANADDLQSLLGPSRVGSSVSASVVRGGELKELSMTVGSRD
ncbi:MAG: serine protease [Chloroflexi bacterium]|nr:serine protease [Chloroflexota bacterium]MBV9134477.1 serine protease [Chloroflexota bacterium]MBV9897973.1 serine protease [Chloroflexota bacterium]